MNVITHFGLWVLGLEQAQTQTTEAERDCIARYAVGKRRLAEIGVWHGVTTCRIIGAMAPDATLFAVDPYPRGRLGFSMHSVIAHREVARTRNDSIQWLRLTGAQAARHLSGSKPFDFVFIDGDHSYNGIKEDWEGWKPLMAPGGVIALHDSHSTKERNIAGAGSVVFTNEVILTSPEFEVADQVDSLTVVQRAPRPFINRTQSNGPKVPPFPRKNTFRDE